MPPVIGLIGEAASAVAGVVSTVAKEGVKLVEHSPGMQLMSNIVPDQHDIDPDKKNAHHGAADDPNSNDSPPGASN